VLPPLPHAVPAFSVQQKTRGFYELYEGCDTILKIDNFQRHATLINAPTVLKQYREKKDSHLRHFNDEKNKQ